MEHQFSSVAQSCLTLCNPMNCSTPRLPAAAKSLQSCPTLCNPTDGSPPGSATPGILQAGILEWVAISFSNAWKGKVKVKSLSHVQLFATPWTAAHQAPLSMGFYRQEYWSGWPLPSQQASLSITNSWSSPRLIPSSQWFHPAISSSVVPFSCPQSLLASDSFPMSQFFAWGGQSIGVLALASVLPKNTQNWSPLEWTGWISLQSKGLSRVFSNTTVQRHQFFGAQLSSQSNSHIHTWPLEKP